MPNYVFYLSVLAHTFFCKTYTAFEKKQEKCGLDVAPSKQAQNLHTSMQCTKE